MRKNFLARARSGFTFIEIMLVVVIIGILASLVVPKLTGQTEKARENFTKNQMGAIKTALGMYEAASGTFPTTSEGLDALVHRPSTFPEAEWKRSFLDKIPEDGWGRPYQYAFPSTHGTDYDLSSSGRDGQQGTADDVTNWEGVGESKL